ncbi:hypothetical protein [Rhodopirellula halodulae]|uniref:hypothetical protein n=1 Tax=Rhodopirellula halodulae TaxID=2894198 RepID=UPI001E651CE7|nr:hypothetical protein [Rhodopirellula sp. JC737]MCC9656709.1 hypothetical protein [Rhodopirellula sp. JC737]
MMLRFIPVFFLFVAFGCSSDLPNGTWGVIGEAIPLGVEEAHEVDTGELAVFETWGLPVRSREKTTFLLWTNSSENPFGLREGDRFRFATSVDKRYFDESHDGYHVGRDDIEIVDD